MLNLSELTAYYIAYNFQPELQKTIFNSFTILELFGINFYEDKYVDLIQREDTIDRDNKRDNFIQLLRQDIANVIREHYIYLDYDSEPELYELNEIANFLYMIQNREDYTEVSYRLHSDDSSRNIVIDLIEQLTTTSKVRLMEIIDHVEDTLVEALKGFTESRMTDTTPEQLNQTRLKYIQTFFNFIENTECLGLTLYQRGYTNLTLTELNDILTFSIASHIDNHLQYNTAQAALDTLSLLIVTKDDYDIPVLKFNKNTSIFTHKLENVTRLSHLILNMLNDFNMHLEATRQQEQVQ